MSRDRVRGSIPIHDDPSLWTNVVTWALLEEEARKREGISVRVGDRHPLQDSTRAIIRTDEGEHRTLLQPRLAERVHSGSVREGRVDLAVSHSQREGDRKIYPGLIPSHPLIDGPSVDELQPSERGVRRLSGRAVDDI